MGKKYCNIENKWCKGLKKGICTWCQKDITSITRCPRIVAIETKRLSELLKEVTFENAFAALCKWFRDQEQSVEGYKEVFNKLCTMVPHRHKLTDMFIHIDIVREDDPEDQDWLNVSGMEPNNVTHYGIEFCKWNDWISMYITQDTLNALSPEEIVGACLYEMTFFGFSENTVQYKKEELFESVKKAKEAAKNL